MGVGFFGSLSRYSFDQNLKLDFRFFTPGSYRGISPCLVGSTISGLPLSSTV
jgi:hypothetical protein